MKLVQFCAMASTKIRKWLFGWGPSTCSLHEQNNHKGGRGARMGFIAVPFEEGVLQEMITNFLFRRHWTYWMVPYKVTTIMEWKMWHFEPICAYALWAHLHGFASFCPSVCDLTKIQTLENNCISESMKCSSYHGKCYGKGSLADLEV